ncbi:MAG: VOC family protein [Chloroflexota bacterium]
MIAGLEHVGIVTGAVDASIGFWHELLSTDVLERHVARGAWDPGRHGLFSATYLPVPHSETLLELVHAETQWSHEGWRDTDIGAIHVALHVKDADRTLVRLASDTRSTAIPYGPCRGGRSAYLADPGGMSVQLMQLVRRPGGMPIIAADGWIDHVGVVVENMARSVSFYRQLLGADPIAENAWRGTNSEYVGRMLGQPGLELEAVHFRLPGGNAQLELVQYSGISQGRRSAADRRSGGHFAFLAERTTGTPETIAEEAVVVPSGRYQGAYELRTNDPDGVPISIIYPRQNRRHAAR